MDKLCDAGLLKKSIAINSEIVSAPVLYLRLFCPKMALPHSTYIIYSELRTDKRPGNSPHKVLQEPLAVKDKAEKTPKRTS